VLRPSHRALYKPKCAYLVECKLVFAILQQSLDVHAVCFSLNEFILVGSTWEPCGSESCDKRMGSSEKQNYLNSKIVAR
jgi:hypothetical protein